MKCLLLSAAVALALTAKAVSAMTLPPSATTMATRFSAIREVDDSSSDVSGVPASHPLAAYRSRPFQRWRTRSGLPLAMAIPGYGLTEQVFVGGMQNFLGIYNAVITVRILLSWFPQAQSIGALQPVFAITDPYLNLFRGVIPPIAGLDLSPLAAFFMLNLLTKATVAVGCDIPDRMKKMQEQMSSRGVFGRALMPRRFVSRRM